MASGLVGVRNIAGSSRARPRATMGAMPTHRIRARPPRDELRLPALVRDPDVLSSVIEDAAHFPGGRASAVAQPASEGEVAALLRHAPAILPIGAQSSLTGGATPLGEVVMRTSRLASILDLQSGAARVQAGVRLAELQVALAAKGLFYPPVPTYTGACCGGVVATDAAGPATFKYGTTRSWVIGLTVVLPTGEVLDLERGQARAHPDGYFEIELAHRVVRVPVATTHRPAVPKCSAGYYGVPGMDLVDLFVGSEGTLGVITEVTFRVTAAPPARLTVMVQAPREGIAFDLARVLRERSHTTWASKDPRGLDVASIEHIDGRSIALLREDGDDRRLGVDLAPGTAAVLFVEVELPERLAEGDLWRQIEQALAAGAADAPVTHLCRELDRFGLLGSAEVVLPGHDARAQRIAELREAVPSTVNRRIALARATVSPAISKTAADVIVPFDRFGDLMVACRQAFESRALDYAVWGHISDGNIHPNVIPRDADDASRGREAVLAVGRAAIALGGSPLAEHGVGRNPVKKQLLQDLHGLDVIDRFRLIKAALDPAGTLAPGVLL